MTAPLPTERQTHRAVLRMVKACFPHTIAHHSPNGAHLAGSNTARFKQVGALKGDGMLCGFPDILIFWAHGRGGLLEVKREFGPRGGGGGIVSPEQIALHAKLAGIGWPVAIVRTVDEAYMKLREWGAPWSGSDPRIVKLVDEYHPAVRA